MPIDDLGATHPGKGSVDSVRDAKLRIKELKLKKKEYRAAKREITSQIAYLRSSRRSMPTSRDMPVRVRGRMGKFMRAVGRTSDHTAQAGFATAIRALEYQKAQLDYSIVQVDRSILQLERYILDNSS
jgi:hypothetical protein